STAWFVSERCTSSTVRFSVSLIASRMAARPAVVVIRSSATLHSAVLVESRHANARNGLRRYRAAHWHDQGPVNRSPAFAREQSANEALRVAVLDQRRILVERKARGARRALGRLLPPLFDRHVFAERSKRVLHGRPRASNA